MIESNPKLFNSSESGQALAFFTYAVQGNLREEEDYLREVQEPISSYSSYEKAFSYTSTDPNLTPDMLARSFRRLLGEPTVRWRIAVHFNPPKPVGDKFQALVTATLKKHYNFRARQLIRELETVLARYQWQEADRLTYDALFTSAYSKNLNFSPSNIACSRLQEIDSLWSKYSSDRFGFRVQKDIYEKIDNTLEQDNDVSWIKFTHEVGWIRINGNTEEISSFYDNRIQGLSYFSLLWPMDGKEWQASETPLGHLPAPGVRYLNPDVGESRARTIGQFETAERASRRFLYRIVNCSL